MRMKMINSIKTADCVPAIGLGFFCENPIGFLTLKAARYVSSIISSQTLKPTRYIRSQKECQTGKPGVIERAAVWLKK